MVNLQGILCEPPRVPEFRSSRFNAKKRAEDQESCPQRNYSGTGARKRGFPFGATRNVAVRRTNLAWARIGKVLRAEFEAVEKEPLPERWVDLIKHLNQSEQRQAKDLKRSAPSSGRVRRRSRLSHRKNARTARNRVACG